MQKPPIPARNVRVRMNAFVVGVRQEEEGKQSEG